MVEPVDREVEASRERGGGEAKEHDQGDKGPSNQGKVQAVESNVAAVDKGGKKKGQQQQQGKGQGQGKRPPCYLCGGPHLCERLPKS